jgi:hypothetical protein
MSRADYFAPGQWNFYCDLCGRKNKSGNAMLTWDGHYVCKEHKEVRNPQDFVRGVAAEAAIPWRRSNSGWQTPTPPVYGGWFALGIQTATASGFGTGSWHPRLPETSHLTIAETFAAETESLQMLSAGGLNFSETLGFSELFTISTPSGTLERSLNSAPLDTITLG